MRQQAAAGSFETLTHARLRAGQGDVSGAVRILRVLLRADPGHGEARILMDELQGHAAAVAAPADARALRDRLETWLVRLVARRGVRHAR